MRHKPRRKVNLWSRRLWRDVFRYRGRRNKEALSAKVKKTLPDAGRGGFLLTLRRV